MAGETYYFLFSIIAVLGITFFLANLLLIRFKGKTTFGISLRPGTEEYTNGIRFARNRNIVIATAIALAVYANMAYEIIRLIHFENQDYARGLLTYSPLITLGLILFMVYIGRKQTGVTKDISNTKKKK